jgi:hypothetical protein
MEKSAFGWYFFNTKEQRREDTKINPIHTFVSLFLRLFVLKIVALNMTSNNCHSDRREESL